MISSCFNYHTHYKFPSCKKSKLISSSLRTKISVRGVSTLTRRYETMLILRPDIPDEEKVRQLAKFEALLANEGAQEIDTTIKGRQKISYSMRGHRDGIFVLFRYKASAAAANAVQTNLANPDAETQGNILRWVNFKCQ